MNSDCLQHFHDVHSNITGSLWYWKKFNLMIRRKFRRRLALVSSACVKCRRVHTCDSQVEAPAAGQLSEQTRACRRPSSSGETPRTLEAPGVKHQCCCHGYLQSNTEADLEAKRLRCPRLSCQPIRSMHHIISFSVTLSCRGDFKSVSSDVLTHPVSLCLSLSLSVPLCLSVFLSLSLCVSVPLCLSVFLSLSVSLSLCVSLYLSLCLSVAMTLGLLSLSAVKPSPVPKLCTVSPCLCCLCCLDVLPGRFSSLGPQQWAEPVSCLRPSSPEMKRSCVLYLSGCRDSQFQQQLRPNVSKHKRTLHAEWLVSEALISDYWLYLLMHSCVHHFNVAAAKNWADWKIPDQSRGLSSVNELKSPNKFKNVENNWIFLQS